MTGGLIDNDSGRGHLARGSSPTRNRARGTLLIGGRQILDEPYDPRLEAALVHHGLDYGPAELPLLLRQRRPLDAPNDQHEAVVLDRERVRDLGRRVLALTGLAAALAAHD